MGLSEKLMLKLRRAQDLESQKAKKNLNLEETLEMVLDLYLEKRDPVKKAQRQKAKGKLRTVVKNNSREECEKLKQEKEKPQKQTPSLEAKTKLSSKKTQKRKALPAETIHRVQLRDQGRCSHIDPHSQKRCGARRFLEIHHIKPLSEGGSDDVDNLQLLCSGHHKMVHRMRPSATGGT